jgi:RNA polymerase sigma factor (sigma-70 family)
VTVTDATSSSLATRAASAFSAYRAGDLTAMDTLVDALTPILWHAARSQGATEDAARDAVQIAWLKLVESSDRIRDPAAVMGWLLVTVRRECWRRGRTESRVEPGLDDTTPDRGPEPAHLVAANEERRALWRHVGSLSPRCQALLRVVAFAERPDYAAVSESLRMPVGSIGPTRGRCLAKLRESLAADAAWGGHP